MTRSVTIVNTANWEHEDVEVNQLNLRAMDKTVRLKPGEMTVVGSHYKDLVSIIRIAPVEEKEPAPFKDADGNQDWPRVDVHKPVQTKDR